MLIDYDQILNLEKQFRANFINSLSGFKSANLIGTKSLNGLYNLAIFNSVVHIGANPPYIGFIQRPDSVERHTFENIEQTKEFTINQVNKSIYKQAHQTAARYKREENEFDNCKLTKQFLNNFNSPFVKESSIKIAASLADIIDIKVNNTKLIVGKILFVDFNSKTQHADGSLQIEKDNTVAISGLDTYYTTKKIAKLSYAKPNSLPNEII